MTDSAAEAERINSRQAYADGIGTCFNQAEQAAINAAKAYARL